MSRSFGSVQRIPLSAAAAAAAAFTPPRAIVLETQRSRDVLHCHHYTTNTYLFGVLTLDSLLGEYVYYSISLQCHITIITKNTLNMLLISNVQINNKKLNKQ